MDNFQAWVQTGLGVAIAVWFFTKGLPAHEQEIKDLSTARDADAKEFRDLIQQIQNQQTADLKSLEVAFQAAIEKMGERTDKSIDRLVDALTTKT